MVISGYYNEINGCLMLSKSQSASATMKKIDESTILIMDGTEVIGVNHFCAGFDSGLVDLKLVDPSLLAHFSADSIEAPFCYGYIKSASKHPHSEKLQVCEVELADQKIVQIVCGASNCVEGVIAVVAKLGAVMPNMMPIVESKVHKVDSFGMLCSLRELGLEQEEPGIKLFEKTAKEIGTPVLKKDLV